MIQILEKSWRFISILLVLVLVSALSFMPSNAGAFSIIMLVLSIGMATVFIVRRQLQAYHAGEINRAGLIRNIVVEIIGLLLTIMLAALIVRSVAETMNPSSDWMGTIIAVALSILIGMVIGWLVKVTWGRLAAE